MGCACCRDEEPSLPSKLPGRKTSKKQSKRVTREIKVTTAPVSRRGMSPSSARQPQLKSPDSFSRVFSPRREASENPQHSKSFWPDQRSQSLVSSRRGSTIRGDIKPIVRLKDFRTFFGGLKSCYELKKERMGNLVKAEHRTTKKKCWIQALSQEKRNSKRKQELLTMRSLDHPNLLKVLDLLEDDDNLYVVYEGTSGGTAAEISTKGISEEWAASIMRQVFAALSHCHFKGFVLKSLSLKHILFIEPPAEDCILVKLLVSLGDVETNSVCMAPEVKNKTYIGPKNNMWSCGMIMSRLLSGEYVLVKRDMSEVTQEIKSAYTKWYGISELAKSLAQILISKKYNTRPTPEECLQHLWIASSQRSPQLTHCVRKALRHMAQHKPPTSLKKALLQLMQNLVIPSTDLGEARKAFKELDTNLDGMLSEAELQAQFFRLFPEEQALAAIKVITSTAVFSEDRRLSYSEFLLWASSKNIFATGTHVATAFQLLDRKKDGLVTINELREVFAVAPEGPRSWSFLISLISTTDRGFCYEDLCRFMKEQ